MVSVTRETHTVSVIVPIYNAEKFLDKCLHSIVTQSYPYLEIICVNDGSTDESPEIIEKYRKRDSRIVVINQENKGLSAARNAGTDKASGNYITYVDADDFIEVNMIEVMLKNIITYDTDIVFEAVWPYDDLTKTRLPKEVPYFTLSWIDSSFDNRAFSYTELLDELFLLPVMAWAKLYNAEFLKKSGVRFPDGLIYEDNIFFFGLLFKTNKISIDRRQLYNYRLNVRNSIINSPKKRVFDMIEIMDRLEALLKKQPFYESIKLDFLLYRINSLMRPLKFLGGKTERKYFYKLQEEFLNIDLLYYNEAILAQKPFYKIYCEIRNYSYYRYKINRIVDNLKERLRL